MATGRHASRRHSRAHEAILTAAVASARRGDEEGFRAGPRTRLLVYRMLHPSLLSYLTARLGDDQAAAGGSLRHVAGHRPRGAHLPGRRHRRHPAPAVGAACDLVDALLLREVAGLDDAAAARVLGATASAAQAASRRGPNSPPPSPR